MFTYAENFMIVQGSLNFTYSGRKKKSYNKKKTKPFIPLAPKKELQFKRSWWEEERQAKKSAPFKPFEPRKVEDTSYRQEISKKYTVSIPYNKGNYQVIPNEDIKHIGK